MALLFIDAVIDPNNRVLHLKYVLFGLVILLWISSAFFEKIKKPPPIIIIALVFISFFMPFYALSTGLINNFLKNTSLETIVYFNSFFFFLLTLIIFDKKIDLTKIINYSSLLIVVITIGSYCILVFDPSFFGNLVQYLVIDKNVAAFGFRNYGDYTILMMYFRTSPLLVFPLAYFLHQLLIKNNRRFFILQVIVLLSIIITLILSGTRANWISLFLIISFYICFFAYKKSKIIFVILCFALIIIGSYVVSDVVNILLDKGELSNTVKHGHLVSYKEYFSQHKFEFLFGQGLGRSFYSSGFNKLTLVTELTYLEIIRIWGLAVFLVFMTVLSLPIIKEIRSGSISPLLIAYIAYLFIAGTNPFLLGSTGMMVLVYVFSKSFQVQKPSKMLITTL